MQVVALVESADHVCCRYRIAAFQPLLAAADIQLTLQPLPKSPVRRLRIYQKLKQYDAVILQRRLYSPPEVWYLKRSVKKLIFDFDDAVYLRDSYSGKGFESRKRSNRFRSTVQAADVIVAGNRFLAEAAMEQQTRGTVAFIPTVVDPSRYAVAKHETPAGQATLVWVGSSSTLKGLELHRELLEAIGQAIPGITLKLVCDRFIELKHLPVQGVPWSEATEAEEIASADIGISLVPDDPWSRGKCGLKLLQYQAAGLPVVANPVGVQIEIARTGGFLAETTEWWIQHIQTLVNSPEQRRRLGRSGREQVELAYSVKSAGKQWLELLQQLR